MDGGYDIGVTVNRPIPAELVDRWRGRVGRDPWVGPWQPELGASLQRVPSDPTTAVAVIPLTVTRGDLGALIAMTSVPHGVDYLQARLPVLTSFGALAGALLAPGILERQRRGAIRGEIEDLLADASFRPVFQPITELRTGRVIGFEALTRFADGTRPDRRFADAAAVGLGTELEAATINSALQASALLPDDAWLSLNVSPDFLLDDGRPATLLSRRGRRALVLEITEHVAIDDYERVRGAVAALGKGVGVSVDDAGAGYASFRHILELRPGFVKLDLGLVRGIDSDEVRQALVAGIVYFAERTGCRLIAEGVETETERARLQKLGVEFGQGYLLGRPLPIEAIMDRSAGDHLTQGARSSRWGRP
jgi:EAL domain-containing protein (putative c-di-GMP-specific phosphodiesterase class I)